MLAVGQRPGLSEAPQSCVVEPYTVLKRLEEEEVRLALKRDNRMRVAVKVMQKRDASRVDRIQAEVAILRTCTKLQHPNLLRLHDVFETEAQTLLVLEFVGGGSLLDLLQRESPRTQDA